MPINVPAPDQRAEWLLSYRMGRVENVFGDFECDVPGCVCVFVSLADLLVHWRSGKHGPLGDNESEEKRKTFKYFSRQERYKTRKYREQSQSSSTVISEDESGQKSLNSP